MSAARIWRWPLTVAGLTLFGLVAALLGQSGVWLAVSWIALAVPPLIVAVSLARMTLPRG